MKGDNVEIIHLIIGNPENALLFPSKEDLLRVQEYLRIYKDRYRIDVLAFSFLQKICHLILRDMEGQLKPFVEEVCEAYGYYFTLRYGEEVRINFKQSGIKSTRQLLKLMRYLHSSGNSSAGAYASYTRYASHPLLNIGLVFHTLHRDLSKGKERFHLEMVKENEAAYTAHLKAQETFQHDKMTKRRLRARTFLDSFLQLHEMRREELHLQENGWILEELVRRFREETDLSYRDIGHVLGLSHTSVIRLLKN